MWGRNSGSETLISLPKASLPHTLTLNLGTVGTRNSCDRGNVNAVTGRWNSGTPLTDQPSDQSMAFFFFLRQVSPYQISFLLGCRLEIRRHLFLLAPFAAETSPVSCQRCHFHISMWWLSTAAYFETEVIINLPTSEHCKHISISNERRPKLKHPHLYFRQLCTKHCSWPEFSRWQSVMDDDWGRVIPGGQSSQGREMDTVAYSLR